MTSLRPVDAAGALPAASGARRVAGPAGRVLIRRDRWGIAHIDASTVGDVFFGQGFATAQDRLWQLEWDRRRALGRSAELVGRPAEVSSDAFHRRARIGDASRRGYDALDGTTRAILDAHAAGINAFLASDDARPVELQALGVEPEPWEGWHGVAVFLVRHVTFATWQTKLWRARLLAALGPDAVTAWRNEGAGDTPLIVPPGVRQAVDRLASAGLLTAPGGPADAAAALADLGLGLSGSNAWVVDGSRTASGAPLLAGDPHRAYELPNVYYQVRLRGAGIDAAGFSFPGVPGIPHFGQSDRTAWGVTNAMAEYQDLFVERLENDGAGAVRVLGPGATWRDADVHTETVVVRDGDPVDVLCVATAHGPVIVGGPEHGVGVALASTGLDGPGGSIACVLAQLVATDVSQLDAALARWVEPANNAVLADDSGAIAYRTAGRVPVRPEAAAWLPVPGWTGGFDWQGTVPDAELPRVVSPEGGAIVTANQRVVGDGYPHVLGVDAASADRADRIWARLGDGRDLTVADHAAIHRDALSLPLLRVATLVAALTDAELAAAGGTAATDVVAARDLLVGWDGRMLADSAAAGVAAAVRTELVGLVLADLPAALRANPFAPWEPPATSLPPPFRVAQALDGVLRRQPPTPAVVAEAVRRAVVALPPPGPDGAGWRWGPRHWLQPVHPLRGLDAAFDALIDVRSGPLDGDIDCVWATNSAPGITDQVRTGSTARYVWDLGDRRRSRWIAPLGASGHPASPHLRDQQAAWSAGELVPIDWDGTDGPTLTLDPT